MWFSKKNRENQSSHSDHVAGLIAQQIIDLQRRLSERINSRVNRYQSRVQLRWFRLLCVLGLCALLGSVLITTRMHLMPVIRTTVIPIHIGYRSTGPLFRKDSTKTDSIHLKSYPYGNH